MDSAWIDIICVMEGRIVMMEVMNGLGIAQQVCTIQKLINNYQKKAEVVKIFCKNMIDFCFHFCVNYIYISKTH